MVKSIVAYTNKSFNRGVQPWSNPKKLSNLKRSEPEFDQGGSQRQIFAKKIRQAWVECKSL